MTSCHTQIHKPFISELVAKATSLSLVFSFSDLSPLARGLFSTFFLLLSFHFWFPLSNLTNHPFSLLYYSILIPRSFNLSCPKTFFPPTLKLLLFSFLLVLSHNLKFLQSILFELRRRVDLTLYLWSHEPKHGSSGSTKC